MPKQIARDVLLEHLPLRALRRIARGFALCRGVSKLNRAALRGAIADANQVTTEAIVSMLNEGELARITRALGIRDLPVRRREMKARLLGANTLRTPAPVKPAPPEHVAAFIADTQSVGRLFDAYDGDGASRLFVGHGIPLDRLGLASEAFPVPNYEHIMVLYDNSLLGNGSTGLAIGEHGLYWRNPLGLASDRSSLAWHEFIHRPIRCEGEHEIHLGDDSVLHITFLDVRKLARLLKTMQTTIRKSGPKSGMPVLTPNLRAAARICRRYNAPSLQSFRFCPKISKRRLVQARSAFSIPDFENIEVLCDNTVFGNCQSGFAFGIHGIYWRNTPGEHSSRHALTWPEFALAHVRMEKDELVTLGDNVHIHLEFLSCEQGAQLFLELQRLVRGAVDTFARTGASETGKRRDTKRWDGYPQTYAPVFVARARDEVARNRIPEQLTELFWQSADLSFTLTASALSGLLRGLRLRR